MQASVNITRQRTSTQLTQVACPEPRLNTLMTDLVLFRGKRSYPCELATIVNRPHQMQLAAQRLQVDRSKSSTLVCLHQCCRASDHRKLDRIGFSFESVMHRKSALQLPMMMMLGKEQLSGL